MINSQAPVGSSLRRDGKPRKRRARRVFGTYQWVRRPGTPRPRWCSLPWWPEADLRLRHGWSAARVLVWVAEHFPDPLLPSSATLQRISAQLHREWIRQRTGTKVHAALLALLRRSQIMRCYGCTCQGKTLCPGPPALPLRRHDLRGRDGRFALKRAQAPSATGVERNSKTQRNVGLTGGYHGSRMVQPCAHVGLLQWPSNTPAPYPPGAQSKDAAVGC